MWDDFGGAGGGLALLRHGQRSCSHLGLGKQAHLQLHGHLPGSGHLAHELRSSRTSRTMLRPAEHPETFLSGWRWVERRTGTSTAVCAARSHSQQAMAVSMPCSVNIFRGDQHRWCRRRGSQSATKQYKLLLDISQFEKAASSEKTQKENNRQRQPQQ